MNFLTAHWRHLILVNYIVPPEVLAPYVPRKTRIDAFDGHVFVSLVAFLFDRTRLLGLPIPFHVTFEEVNVRFYVTPESDPSQRAVTFIKELVPRKAIPLIANRLFDENYEALPMTHHNDESHHSYSWTNKVVNSVSGRITKELMYPAAGSIGEFITEHYWGYSRGANQTLEYRVDHPPWKCCELDDFTVSVDFAETYGSAFGFLSAQKPYNVLYAAGSEVSVSFPRRL